MTTHVPSPATAVGRRELADFYLEQLHEGLLPFWLERAVDTERGGVFTCFDNRGERLLSRDKYTWSQGRFAWLTARLARLASVGVVRGDPATYLALSRSTVAFLRAHVLLDDGLCAYLLTEEGTPKEAFPGAGLAPSRFADAFVLLGAAELAAAEWESVAGSSAAGSAVAGSPGVGSRMAGSARPDPALARGVADWALGLYRPLARAMATGNVPSAPYPIPDGCSAHSFPMIMVNVSQTLGDALSSLGHAATAALDADRRMFVDRVMSYTQADGGVMEVRFGDDLAGAVTNGGEPEPWPVEGGGARGNRPDGVAASTDRADTLLFRHANPGHALESMWFLLHESVPGHRDEVTVRALAVIDQSLTIGWDDEYGGILRFVGIDGGPPTGRNTGEPMDQLIHDTWSSKLWWPHSEALYASLLAYRLAGGTDRLAWYERVHGYTFATFPNRDAGVGEWIQIRDRSGAPMDKVVALPVKDPFHIVRNVLMVLELLSRWESETPCG